MRIACISDTHTMGVGKQTLPEADVLVHAGDMTFQGTEPEIRNSLAWLNGLPYKHIVCIAGNHDLFFDEAAFPHGTQFRNWVINREAGCGDGTVAGLMKGYPNVTYLQDSSCEIGGLKFYGSPWQPYFWGWAFNLPLLYPMKWNQYQVNPDQYDLEAAQAIWSKIPLDTDVLITHGPPRGFRDAEGAKVDWDDERLGCPVLREHVKIVQPKAHIFGHIHEGYGTETKVWESGRETQFVNAAICTREYRPSNAPIVIEV